MLLRLLLPPPLLLLLCRLVQCLVYFSVVNNSV